MRAHYWESRQSMTPQKALEFLREGNERFLKNLHLNRNNLQLVNETAEKQFPFAAILSCSDSRVCAELIFDQGLGDIFSIRLAGNIASVNAIGSMEYAVKELDSKLIVVMGHSNCGAVRGACDNISMDNLNALLDHIYPAVEAETETRENRNSSNKQFVANVTRLNVQHHIQVTLQKSTIIRNMVSSGAIGICGAIYEVETGKVEFIEYHPQKLMNHEWHAVKA
jgi:Carbonic anhydrase